MAIRITDDTMSLETDNRAVATARYSKDAAADGNGAWIVSTHPARLFAQNQASTALTVAGLERAGTRTAVRWWSRSETSCDNRPAYHPSWVI